MDFDRFLWIIREKAANALDIGLCSVSIEQTEKNGDDSEANAELKVSRLHSRLH